MLVRNDIFEMTCDAFGQDAQGVCRHEGMAVFVPGMLPGETAMVRIVKPEKRYAFGRVEQLLTKSPDRREPFCPSYKRCGGCSCQHMRYETALDFKRDQVQELLRRVGGLSIAVPPVIGMEEPFAYRNKGAYPVGEQRGEPVCGFFAPRTHDLIALPKEGCRIQREDANAAVRAALAWMKRSGARAYEETSGRGLVRHVMTRATPAGGLMVVLVVTKAQIIIHAPPGKGVYLFYKLLGGGGQQTLLPNGAKMPVPLHGNGAARHNKQVGCACRHGLFKIVFDVCH